MVKENAKDRKLVLVSSFVGLVWVMASLILRSLSPGGWLRFLIGVIPIVLLLYQLMIMYRYVRNQDELLRRISLEALAYAFPFGLIGVFLIGFLMRSGVALRLDFMDAGYLMIAGYVAGYFLAQRRYR